MRGATAMTDTPATETPAATPGEDAAATSPPEDADVVDLREDSLREARLRDAGPGEDGSREEDTLREHTLPGRRDAMAERTAELLVRLAAEQDETERQRLTDEVVLLNLPLARSLAMRYRERGVPLDDLMQVAALGLVKAVHGFDAERGRDFMAYAAPTITGEIKRHFRDTGWAVRPPRRLQELRTRVAQATQTLSQATGRAPTVKELAEALQVPQDDVVEAMVSSNGYATTSLDAPPDGESGSWADSVPDVDADLSGTPDRVALERLLSQLPERERRILAMRFFADKTQSEIGAEIGVTQMQVSRLLSRALRRLREQLEDDPDAAGGMA